MTINDQLERRANRGLPRGAASVLASAQHQLRDESEPSTRSSVWGLRVVLALSAAALIVVAGIRTTTFDRPAISAVASPAASSPAAAPTEGADGSPGQPAPILISGMQLRNVLEPWEPTAEQKIEMATDQTPKVTSTRVYASSADPFGGPVLGIDTLEGGGFSPWSANLSDAELRSLTETIERDGTSWRLADASDLTEVAQFSDDSELMMTNVWQFDFADGNLTATLQAEAGAPVWVWASRLLRSQSGDERLEVSTIDVLDHAGLLVGDEAIWEADGFAYRLTGGEITGDTHFGRPVGSLPSQLELVDRAEWSASVNQAGNGAGSVSFSQSVGYVASLAAVAAWIIVAVLVAIRRPRYLLPAVGLGLFGFVSFWALAPNLWLALVTFAVVVAILLWLNGTRWASFFDESA